MLNKKKIRKKAADIHYIAPTISKEPLTSILFRKTSLKDEISEFNLLAADESDISDDY